jgi:hypothetical protein
MLSELRARLGRKQSATSAAASAAAAPQASADDLRREAYFQEFIAVRVSDPRQKAVLLGRAGQLRRHAEFLEQRTWRSA